MIIRRIAARNFRGLYRWELSGCANVNILIGKNSSGKSNILSAIDIAVGQFTTGRLISNWPSRGRQADEFTDRDVSSTIQVGIEFAIEPNENAAIRGFIVQHTEGMDNALRALETQDTLTVIVAGALVDDVAARYVQELGLGPMDATGDKLTSGQSKILSIPDQAARTLVVNSRLIETLQQDISAIERVVADFRESPLFSRPRETRTRYDMRSYSRSYSSLSPITRQRIDIALEQSATIDEFDTVVRDIVAGEKAQLTQIEDASTDEAITSFSGQVRRVPEYLSDIIGIIGSTSILHFKETRPAIGLAEAGQLLNLKTKRGGPERLAAFQDTVKSLLGVSVDAFSAESDGEFDPLERRGQRSAEIDIDQFLVEANGAGVREALRILLDMELTKPRIALIEEPEVHLHPGLESVMHSYIVGRGENTQIFVATHSTSFIDVSDRQNVYAVSKDASGRTTSRLLVSQDDVLKIPSEIGLRPSLVLMFDRLAFVEGVSDEAVLLALAHTLEVDFTAANVGFVRMGGSGNTRFFASDATLDLLSKRQIPMVFVVDRDERDENELNKAAARIGERAKLHWLRRREIENYLLVPRAIRELILLKRSSSGKGDETPPNEAEIAQDIDDVAKSLRDEVVRLTQSRELLTPIYPDRMDAATILDRLLLAEAEIQARVSELEVRSEDIQKKVAEHWDQHAASRAKGSDILTATLGRYGLAYNKGRDAGKLAALLSRDEIDGELKGLIRQVGGV